MTNSLKMQTLRKKTSPLKYKNETSRFLGEGVSFKAKLIGILEVSEARGDRMCQDALSDLKMAIRAAGEHKQRIIINIAIDGLRLRDEKTGDSLYHHPVHKISFIAQDMTDTRAFGYIFGSPETGHRFFGIKTDKAASQVVIAMRDLFQVVFALKKKEIELAKQHLDKGRYSSSPLFSETSLITTKGTEQTSTKTINEHKPLSATTSNKSGNEAVADLVDLELELNNLQQGLTQMERITPSDPFGSKEDPFGDSFTAYPQKPILPPPPSGRDRSSRNSETSSRTPATASSSTVSATDKMTNKVFTFSQDFSTSFEDHSSGDWFTPPASNSVAEEPPLIAKPAENADANRVESQFDVFTELDPLGTGKSKPYVDKKLFFQELKNPPKKVLNDLVPQIPELSLLNSFTQSTKPAFPGADMFPSDPFQEDPFKEDPFAETDFSKQDPFNTDYPGLNLLVKDSLSSLSKSPQFIAQPVKETFQYAYSDMSTESVPEPPPRPSNNVQEIKPPPLPPKKQPGELLIKPPPRPPHVDDFHREESFTQPKDCPPLPVPLRKPKTDSRHHQSDEDYLTPVGFKPTGMQSTQVTIASILESKPNLTVTTASESLDSLDITLSQLTLSGLNELAKKLNIPAEQLSNMTLVQLTSYISNFVKNASGSGGAEEPFKADFAANFGGTTSNEGSYDRYAVFRELFQEENHDNRVQDEEQPDNKQQQEQKVLNTQFEEQSQTTDKYAALREIVEMEIKQIETENLKNVETDFETEKESNIIEYNTPLDKKENEKEEILSKSPTGKRSIKSPIPQAVTEVIQKSTHLTSGSLSDAVSGSSPEIDNTGSTSEIVKKGNDIAGESWAIFEKPNLNRDEKIKQRTQSEEGVSPWSSDSKEFANGSPPEWRQRVDSSSGGDHVYRREQEDWWDTSAEPEAVYNPANRRSTDSYEDEYYDYYDRPRRRRQVFTGTGGHSSSSRDVSPWEEEPHRREPCDHREPKQNWARHSRIHAFDRYRNRRHNDSWDEEDDYEYEEEHSGRFHWPDRHVKAERDRHSREHEDYYGEGWEEGRKYRRRREHDRDRWCCPDWETEFQGKTSVRYPSGRTSNPDQMVRHEKELEEHYYSRDSQESPWDEDEEPRPPHYATTKRNWKQRPSSASETERKTSDGKFRQQYLGMGGSDGERERRSKPNRRSKSRDSQFSDSTYNRHKVEPLPPMRTQHRLKQHPPAKEPDFVPPKKAETLRSDKKNSSLPRKKSKEEPRTGTYPRKKPTFENDFTPPDVESPRTKCSFDSNFGGSSKKSFFEDNFSPTEQSDTFRESKICSILEEPTEECVARLQKVPHSKKKILNRNRFSGDIHLKKSDSVNIFARENDPFDDDFFSSGRNAGDLSWSDNFDEQT